MIFHWLAFCSPLRAREAPLYGRGASLEEFIDVYFSSHPAEFWSCRHAMLQFCSLKDGITLRDNGTLKKFRKRVTSGLDIFHEIEGK